MTDDDDLYALARDFLLALTPERQEAAHAWAAREFPALSNVRRVIEAARHLGLLVGT